ncbi:MAG: protoporphyrinogen oxidase [Candidatus Omnitrophica bacterium]|nr:protoporphyrinogen oxidase [Candidatus Omnitrophota bacterium]
MAKQILIIGGGISGLATLHYLRQRYASRPDVNIQLIEKNERIGGTIQSTRRKGAIFEAGPNGFLNSRQEIMDLIHELDLEEHLLVANPENKKRYICLEDKLYALPKGPARFLSFPILTWQDRFRIFTEIFISRGKKENESVAEFGIRRFGKNITDYLLDPLITGIFAGNIHQLSVRHVLPMLLEYEQKYGSVFKGLFAQKEQLARKMRGQFCSFRGGMEDLIERLGERYSSCIRLGEETLRVEKKDQGFVVETTQMKYFADELFVCTPAFAASKILENECAKLSKLLDEIHYAPIAVVGFLYPRSAFSQPPTGFGYLVPSKENKEILGVIFSSNLFTHRVDDSHHSFRVILGGAHHPQILEKNELDLIALAEKEIQNVLGAQARPEEHFVKTWEKGIPQYDLHYANLINSIESELKVQPHLHLVANYRGGVGINDCILSARQTVESVSF